MYKMVDHLCLICFGRLLIRRLPGRLPKFETICACCEDRPVIDSEENISYWCSKHVGADKEKIQLGGVYGKYFECIPNPNKNLKHQPRFWFEKSRCSWSKRFVRIARYSSKIRMSALKHKSLIFFKVGAAWSTCLNWWIYLWEKYNKLEINCGKRNICRTSYLRMRRTRYSMSNHHITSKPARLSSCCKTISRSCQFSSIRLIGNRAKNTD